MTYLIKKWFLPDELKKDYNTEKLENLSKVNIFIGPNNSGKSWFMRRLISLPNEMISPSDFDIDKVNYFFNEYLQDIKNMLAAKELPDYDSLIEKTSKFKPTKFITTNGSFKEELYNRYKNAINVSPVNEITDTRGRIHTGTDKIFNYIRNSTIAFLQQISDFAESNVRKKYEFDKIYIPVLRGLRGIKEDREKDFYKERTIVDYFKENKLPNSSRIFTGLEIYRLITEHLLGDLDKRKLIRLYEQFLQQFFENKEVAIIPRIEKNNDVVFVKIGNEEYPIYKLGDGIQQLIIMTFPLFINKDKDVLAFIEEPELYLHPGLQRTLLELLSSNEFGNLQTFVTTHSNHFLDMTLDFDKISVYRFSKEIKEDENSEIKASFHIENTSNEDSNLLECLGVKNSSVMLTNCTIWVEGITDRMYLREYLKVYQKDLKNNNPNAKIFEEDKHYSFVEYSGNNITHWSFLDDDPKDESQKGIDEKKLCSILFLLADKDDEKKKAKNERHKKLKEKLGDERYHRLSCREIENLLSPKVLKATIEEIDKITIEDKINYNDYKIKPIGEYIDTILKGKSTKSYRASKTSGSLNSNLKSKFAKIAVSHIKSIDDFSKEAKEICEKLYKFIESNNN